MFDLLTLKEDAQAKAQGWGLYHVYDAGKGLWHVGILPRDAAPKVIELAKNRDELAIKALRLIAHK